MLLVHYHPKLPMSMRASKKDCHTLVECADDEEFDLELSYLETLDPSPSAGWWMVPGSYDCNFD